MKPTLPKLVVCLLAQLTAVLGADSLDRTMLSGCKLKFFVAKPTDWTASEKRPAVVFFVGGVWVTKSPRSASAKGDYQVATGTTPR